MTFGDTVTQSLQSTGTFGLVIIIGIGCANYPAPPHQLLSKASLQAISKLMIKVSAPLLIAYTMGSSVDKAMLEQTGWILILFSVINSLIAAFISGIGLKIFRVPENFRTEFMLAATFQNALAAPYVMMKTMCQQEPLRSLTFGDENGDDVDCEDRSLSYLFLYTVGWMISFFGVAYPWVVIHTVPDEEQDARTKAKDAEDISAIDNESDDVDGNNKISTNRWQLAIIIIKGILNANIIATIVGVVIAVSPDLNSAFFSSNGSFLWVSSAAETVGEPMVGLSAIVVGATLGRTLRRVWLSRRKRQKTTKMAISRTLSFPEPVLIHQDDHTGSERRVSAAGSQRYSSDSTMAMAPLWLHGELSHAACEDLLLSRESDGHLPVDGTWLVHTRSSSGKILSGYVLSVVSDLEVSHYHIDVDIQTAVDDSTDTRSEVRLDGKIVEHVSDLMELLVLLSNRDLVSPDSWPTGLGPYVPTSRVVQWTPAIGNLSSALANPGWKRDDSGYVPSWVIALMVIVKMVVIPAIMISIVIAVIDDFLPESTSDADVKLLKLLLILEPAVPSADFNIVICQQTGRSRGAEALAMGYIFEYVLGIITINVALIVGRSWIGLD